MKIKTLQAALLERVHSADCVGEELGDVIKSLETCTATLERYEGSDLWKQEVTLITDSSLIDILNTLTYDIFGRLSRVHGSELPFSNYANACRRTFGLEQLTDEQLQAGYDFVGDLWQDNENEGNNRRDGSYDDCKELSTDDCEFLRNILSDLLELIPSGNDKRKLQAICKKL